jgi:hypothetical protein
MPQRDEPPIVPDLRPLRRVLSAYARFQKTEARWIEQLLKKSTTKLHPLDDPLLVDLGTHRWLKGSREEAYSDWLAWVLEQVGSVGDIQRILGIEGERPVGSRQPQVIREHPLDEGHEGHTGRIDILVECGSNLVIAVEVKICGAEEADTEKQEGYLRALRKKYPGRSVAPILLATDAEKDRCHGFEVCLWREVCLELRRVIARIRKRRGGLTAAAMVLAFTGAVEQNLLGFHRDGAPGMTAYLQEFIRQEA